MLVSILHRIARLLDRLLRGRDIVSHFGLYERLVHFSRNVRLGLLSFVICGFLQCVLAAAVAVAVQASDLVEHVFSDAIFVDPGVVVLVQPLLFVAAHFDLVGKCLLLLFGSQCDELDVALAHDGLGYLVEMYLERVLAQVASEEFIQITGQQVLSICTCCIARVEVRHF